MHTLIVLLPILAFFAWIAIAYNRLIVARSQQSEVWSKVDQQLTQRITLLTALTDCVGAYRTHEAHSFHEGGASQEPAEVTRQLRTLLALAQTYPELPADQEFAELIRKLNESETILQSALITYNAAVLTLRGLTEKFPSNLIAAVFGLQSAAMFEVESATDPNGTGRV